MAISHIITRERGHQTIVAKFTFPHGVSLSFLSVLRWSLILHCSSMPGLDCRGSSAAISGHHRMTSSSATLRDSVFSRRATPYAPNLPPAVPLADPPYLRTASFPPEESPLGPSHQPLNHLINGHHIGTTGWPCPLYPRDRSPWPPLPNES